jgi:hypothetical protein
VGIFPQVVQLFLDLPPFRQTIGFVGTAVGHILGRRQMGQREVLRPAPERSVTAQLAVDVRSDLKPVADVVLVVYDVSRKVVPDAPPRFAICSQRSGKASRVPIRKV